MKTIEIEIAMMKELDVRTNLIVPNVSWGIQGLHECDLLALSKANYATEIEIKISKSDLLKDAEKEHGHRHEYVARLYFAVPENLKDIALYTIPERAGLYIVKSVYNDWYKDYRNVAELVRGCKRNKYAVKWPDEERYNLARLGTLRILKMKEKILAMQPKTVEIKSNKKS